MFVPIHLLPQFYSEERAKYQNRWHEHVPGQQDGPQAHQLVVELIQRGAGEDFLQRDFQQGILKHFLENEWDLRGLSLVGETINFPKEDNFEAIDFSYAWFHGGAFRNATFTHTGLDLMRISECTFEKCLFYSTGFYGTRLEDSRFIDCDFIYHAGFTNCDLANVQFQHCYMPKRIFFDCRFDERTVVDRPTEDERVMPDRETATHLDNKDLPEIYKGLAEAYRASGAVHQWEQAFFLQRSYATRYVYAKRSWERIWNFMLEFGTGYGVMPVRVFYIMLAFFAIFSLPFVRKVGPADGLLLSAGAFFTFGANTQYLQSLSFFYRTWYIAESFVGVSLVAIFITVWAGRWFRERQ